VKRRAATRGRLPRLRRFLSFLLLVVPPMVAAGALVGWFVYTDVENTVVKKFEGRRWNFASRVFAGAYAIYPGLRLDDASFYSRLTRLGYRESKTIPARPGEYRKSRGSLDLFLHAFEYATHHDPGRLVRFELDASGHVVRMVSTADGSELFDVTLEPELIAGLHGDIAEDRREMKLPEVPTPLVRAIVSVEDRRFFEHPGIDVRGLVRAAFVNVRAGGIRQGGSTLTQQLMKNFFLTEERTLARKVKEVAMALATERRYAKLEILEAYLNEIYLGQRGGVAIHGVWEGSKYYFGREPRELTLGQIATIAAMIRAPNYYSPHAHPERALERRNTVLGVLRDEGEIDEATYLAALAEPLDAVPPPPPVRGSPYFVDFVRKELADRYSKDVLTSEGYAIFTTLDSGLQESAERAVRTGLEQLEKAYSHLRAEGDARLQAALLAVHPRTGAVLAMVGGRDYGTSQYNRVTEARRQPGSVFKPLVYLAALGSTHLGNAHVQPNTLVDDEPFEWEYDNGTKTWSPANYKDKYFGAVSVHDALVFSLNAATARLARDVGIEAIRNLAVRLGIDGTLPPYPAISLGGWEVSPLEIARMYGVLANGGVGAMPLSVSKVVDRGGSLLEGHRVEVERKIPAADAYLVTRLLEDAIDRGTGRGVRDAGFLRPAAGKTGTTNDYNDAWFAGYTADLLAVVWVGFDKGQKLGLSGGAAAVPIWTAFMREALEPRPVARFQVPAGVVLVDIDRATGLRATSGCPEVVREAFLEGEEPTEYCPQHGSLWLPW
jgi:penicillin-binding protein 1B